MKNVLFSFILVLIFSACNKLPEVETAKQVGAQPKQIIDKVSGDTAKAMQQAAERQQSAEKKE